MSYWFPVISFWLSFLFFLLSSRTQENSRRKGLRIASLICICLGGLLFLVWSITRALGFVE